MRQAKVKFYQKVGIHFAPRSHFAPRYARNVRNAVRNAVRSVAVWNQRFASISPFASPDSLLQSCGPQAQQHTRHSCCGTNGVGMFTVQHTLVTGPQIRLGTKDVSDRRLHRFRVVGALQYITNGSQT